MEMVETEEGLDINNVSNHSTELLVSASESSCSTTSTIPISIGSPLTPVSDDFPMPTITSLLKDATTIMEIPKYVGWTVEEFKQLRWLIVNDLTRSSLASTFPTKDILDIVDKIKLRVYDTEKIPWTEPEIMLVYQYLRLGLPLSSTEFPLRSPTKCKQLNTLCMEISDAMKTSEWTVQDVVDFHMALEYEFTTSYIQFLWPHKPIESVLKVINSISVNFPRSLKEELYLNLPEETRSLNEYRAEFPQRIKANKFPAHPRQHIVHETIEIERNGQLYDRVVDISNLRDLSDIYPLEIIDECIDNDLTKSCLQSMFPGEDITNIVQQVMKRINNNADGDDQQEIPFTRGERLRMKKFAADQVPMDTIFNEFPLRTPEYLTRKYKELCLVSHRQRTFKNSYEKLIYEAKWYASMEDSSTSSRSSRRRRRGNEVDLDNLEEEARSISQKKKKTQVSVLSQEEKAKRSAARRVKQEQLAEERRKKRQEKAQLLEYRRQNGLIRPKMEPKTLLTQLKEANDYFMTVAGDRQRINEGEVRRRKRTEHFQPEYNVKIKSLVTKKTLRQLQKEKIKLEKKKLREELKKKREQVRVEKHKKKQSKKRKSNNTKIKIEEQLDDLAEEEVDIKEESPEVQDEISPFDPDDIVRDTLVPLNGRELFIDSIYKAEPFIHKVEYVDNCPSELMTQASTQINTIDTLAADIVTNHIFYYRDLPISFPPLTVMDETTSKPIPNVNNKVNLRFLLYPQHCEQFVLGSPKSNELDPIYEIQKFFQLHYGLYFSHSEKLKKIIVEDYCAKLDHYVDENDFSEFMFIIDKWNKLMIELSPNDIVIDDDQEDINKAVRIYSTRYEEAKQPTAVDLRLDVFFSEMLRKPNDQPDSEEIEHPSPIYDIVTPSIKIVTPPLSGTEEEFKTSINKVSTKREGGPKIEEPQNIQQGLSSYSNANYMKPKSYNKDIFDRLREKSTISRFTTQQIFLRVYSRVVSIDSRKLRSYKAFTAEVYGELLPSFMSEVLTKVNFQPHQKFYDLGSGVGNTAFQAALEFGGQCCGGCELMEHASKLTTLQQNLLNKHLVLFGMKPLNLDFALLQSFVDNEAVRKVALEADVLLVNNYLFDGMLNNEVGRLLYGLKTGTKIISLRNFIAPRYRASGDSIFDRLKVEKHEVSDFLSVSWTANKVPYFISTVQENICPEYLGTHTPE